MSSQPLLVVQACKRCRGRGWYNGKKRGWPVTIICQDCFGRGKIKKRLGGRK